MDLARLLAIGAGLGTVITALTNLVRWWRDRSLSHRLRDQLEQTTRLAGFLSNAPEVANAASDEPLCNEITPKVRQELQRVLRDMNETLVRLDVMRAPSKEMSFYRSWLLLFQPMGIRAGVAHFFFYSSAFAVLTLLWTFFTMDKDDLLFLGYVDRLQALTQSALPILVAVTFAFHYWAIVEHRWSSGLRQNPGRLARIFLWYTPATGGEVIARLALCFAACSWVIAEYAWPRVISSNSIAVIFCSLPSSPGILDKPLAGFLDPLAILVCYFWAKAEFRLFDSAGPRPAFPRNFRFLYKPRTVEGWAAHLAFYCYLAWAAYQIYVFRLAVNPIRAWVSGRVAAAPGLDAHSLFSGVLAGFIIGLAFYNLPPVYGAYRWALAEFRKQNDSPITIEGL